MDEGGAGTWLLELLSMDDPDVDDDRARLKINPWRRKHVQLHHPS